MLNVHRFEKWDRPSNETLLQLAGHKAEVISTVDVASKMRIGVRVKNIFDAVPIEAVKFVEKNLSPTKAKYLEIPENPKVEIYDPPKLKQTILGMNLFTVQPGHPDNDAATKLKKSSSTPKIKKSKSKTKIRKEKINIPSIDAGIATKTSDTQMNATTSRSIDPAQIPPNFRSADPNADIDLGSKRNMEGGEVERDISAPRVVVSKDGNVVQAGWLIKVPKF